jgi:DNA-binding winged helix-turn-helix (wHTH) protein
MNSYHPTLQIKKGESFCKVIEIKPYKSEYKYFVGRQGDEHITKDSTEPIKFEQNHIRLLDKDKVISREHCTLTRELDGWFIIDHSRNGTTLVRSSAQIKVHELKERKCLITDGDHILVEDWELIFCDPDTTVNKKLFLPPSYPWVFNLSQESLFYLKKGKRIKVPLAPQQTKALAYMALRNINNCCKPVVCTYQDLIEAIWGENSFGITPKQIHPIMQKIRQAFEKGEDEPKQLLETKNGEGYLLNIHCEH